MASITCGHCGETHISADSVYICAVIYGVIEPQVTPAETVWDLSDVCDCGTEYDQGDHRRCWQINYFDLGV